MAAPTRLARRTITALGPLFALLLCVATSAQAAPACAASTASTTASTTTKPSGSKSSTHLSAPKTSFAQDTKYYTDVTEADPALVTYEQTHGNVALRALLTDGSAFCALLKRGGGIDAALVAEAQGAQSTESQTSLPLSVTTFNTIESVALLVLCPAEQKLVPASVRSKIRHLGTALKKRPG